MSYNWEETEDKPKGVFFNGGKAGECLCVAKVRDTSVNAETGRNGNPLPKYMLTLSDGNNLDPESGAPKTLELAYYEPKDIDPNVPKSKAYQEITMKSTRWIYEAMCPNKPMPVANTVQEAFHLAMAECIKAGEQKVRAYVRFESKGQASKYLSLMSGYNRGIVNASDTSYVFHNTDFLERLVDADKEQPVTEGAGVKAADDDLPF